MIRSDRRSTCGSASCWLDTARQHRSRERLRRSIDLTEIWLSDPSDPSLGSILGSARATAVVQGRLRPTASATHASQQLSVWVVEVPDAAMAGRPGLMIDCSGAALLGIASGAQFALAVARSFVQGQPPFETTVSLVRFKAPIERVLAGVAEVQMVQLRPDSQAGDRG